MGWSTKTSGGAVFDDDDATVKPTDITSSIKNGSCTVTLYAQWTCLHSKYNSSVTTAPTCTSTGVRTYTCATCSHKYTETIAKTAHTAVIDKAVAATCNTAGKTEGSHCSKCNAVIKAQTTVAALGHSYGSWTTVNAPTCTSTGAQQRVCTKCSAFEVRAIASTGHKDGEWKVTTQPTYTSTGVKTIYCAVCGAAIRTESIPKLIAVKAEVKSVDLGEDNIEINYNNGYKFNPSIAVEGDIGYKVEYSSSNSNCVSVDENGNIYGNKKGSATITCTVTDANGKTVIDTCNVNVTFNFGQWLLYIICFGWIWM